MVSMMLPPTRRLFKFLAKLDIYSARDYLASISVLRHMGSSGIGGSGAMIVTQFYGGNGTYTVPQGTSHITVALTGCGGAGGSAGSAMDSSVFLKAKKSGI